MLRRFLEPKSSDDDSKYRRGAIAVAARFVVALEARQYSEIWHELTARETWAIVPALAYLSRRDDIAELFRLAPEEVTREFLPYAVDNDIERTRTGFCSGVRKQSRKHGWLRTDLGNVQVAFENTGAVVYIPDGREPTTLEAS